MADEDLKALLRDAISQAQQHAGAGGGADLGRAIHELLDAVRTLHGTATMHTPGGLGHVEAELVRSVNAATAFAGRPPVTTGEEAARRLRPYSVEQLSAMHLAPAAGLAQERELLVGDLHQQTFKEVQKRIQAGNIPTVGSAGADAAEIVPKVLGENSERMRSTMERLTDSVKQGVDAGATFRMGMGMMSGGGMGQAFRAQATGMLGDMMAAAPEAAPFLGGGMLAAGLVSQISQGRAQMTSEAHALELGPGMTQQPELQQAGGWHWGVGTPEAQQLDIQLKQLASQTNIDFPTAQQTAINLQQAGVGQGQTPIAAANQVAQFARGAVGVASETGLATPDVATLMGQMSSQGGMNFDQIIGSFDDLEQASEKLGVSVGTVAQSFKDIVSAGGPLDISTAGLAAVQKTLGPGVNVASFLGPLMSTEGTKTMQEAAVLGYTSQAQMMKDQKAVVPFVSRLLQLPQKMGIKASDPFAEAQMEAVYTSALGHDPFSGMSEDKRYALEQQILEGKVSPDQLARDFHMAQPKPSHDQRHQQRKRLDQHLAAAGASKWWGQSWMEELGTAKSQIGAGDFSPLGAMATNPWISPLGWGISEVWPHGKGHWGGRGEGGLSGAGGFDAPSPGMNAYLATTAAEVHRQLGVAASGGPAGLRGTPEAAGGLTAQQMGQVAASLSGALNSPAVHSAFVRIFEGTPAGGSGSGGHEAATLASTFTAQLMRTLIPALARDLGEAFENAQVRTAIAQALSTALQSVSGGPGGGAPGGGGPAVVGTPLAGGANYVVPRGGITVAGHQVSHQILQAYAAASKATGVDLPTLLAQTAQESGFQTGVVSADHGYGLAQFTDPNVAAKYLHIQKGEDWTKVAKGEGKGGIGRVAEGQAEFMRDLIKQYGVQGALEAYNSGSATGAPGYAAGIQSEASSIVLSGTLVVQDPHGKTVGTAKIDPKTHQVKHKAAKGGRSHGQTQGGFSTRW